MYVFGKQGRGILMHSLITSAFVFSCSNVEPESRIWQLDMFRNEVAELDLPLDNRQGQLVPELLQCTSAFSLSRSTDEFVEYKASLPFRSLGGAVSAAPKMMSVFGPNHERVLFALDQQAVANTWSHDYHNLILRLPRGAACPRVEDYSICFEKAIRGEQALNLESSGLPERDFAFRSLEYQNDSRWGILLPSPLYFL